jgi:hypothetical protein
MAHTDYKTSLQRLIKIARSKTNQSEPIANFLLSLWDADTCGRFDFRELWNIDSDLVEDVASVVKAFAAEHRSLLELGYEEDFLALRQRWRPDSFARS